MNELNTKLSSFLKKLLDHIQEKHQVSFLIHGQELNSTELSHPCGVFPMFIYAAQKVHQQLFEGLPQKLDIEASFFKNEQALFEYEAYFPDNKDLSYALWLHLLTHVTLDNVKDYKLTKKVSFDKIVNTWKFDFKNIPIIKNPSNLEI